MPHPRPRYASSLLHDTLKHSPIVGIEILDLNTAPILKSEKKRSQKKPIARKRVA
jgi:hypothetical protein